MLKQYSEINKLQSILQKKKSVYKDAICFQTLSLFQIKKRNKDVTQIKTHQLLKHFYIAHQNTFWKILPFLKSNIFFELNIQSKFLFWCVESQKLYISIFSKEKSRKVKEFLLNYLNKKKLKLRKET